MQGHRLGPPEKLVTAELSMHEQPPAPSLFRPDLGEGAEPVGCICSEIVKKFWFRIAVVGPCRLATPVCMSI